MTSNHLEDPVKGAEEEPVAEKVKHAVKGEDAPMEETTPKIPFAMVSLTYPLLLVVALLIAVLIWTFFG